MTTEQDHLKKNDLTEERTYKATTFVKIIIIIMTILTYLVCSNFTPS